MLRNSLILAALLFSGAVAFAETGAVAPKYLWTGDEADVVVACDNGVTIAKTDGKMVATFAANGQNQWPGIEFHPQKGDWDLSAQGHVEIELKNTSAKPLSIGLRVDNSGDWRKSPWNSENIYLKPGEKRIGKVIFGYQYGFQKGYKLDPSKVRAVKVFLNGKSKEVRTLELGALIASGASGEKPPVDPSRVVVKPKNGKILPDKAMKTAENIRGFAGAKGEIASDGTARLTFSGDPKGCVMIKPKSGYWNLGEGLKVVLKVKNVGQVSAQTNARVESNGGAARFESKEAILPGKVATLEVPFMPAEMWHLVGDEKNKKASGGTTFESHRVKGITIACATKDAVLQVTEMSVEKVIARIPSFLGKRPPVKGDWVQTLSEEFNGKTLNEKIWSPHSSNFWDKRTHFTRDNLLFKDGCIVLKYEKKRGAKNDDPALGETDYACGILDSYDKWTQCYGYFEARMKLPRAPGLWPAFWTMPDRGPEGGKERWARNSTHKGGMEFDIMEHLTAWGPYRFNIACHWDGYGKEHRAVGTTSLYMPADKDDFIVVGLLWLPGRMSIYGNGVELARWESERVSNVPAHIFLYMVSGGWANEPLDDDLLPDEFRIDWVRAWQRRDLMK